MKLKRFIGYGCLLLLSFFAALSIMFFLPKNYTEAYEGDAYTRCLKRAVHSDDTYLDAEDAAKISSLASVCAICSGDYQYGAMWINSFPGTNTDEGVLDAYVYDQHVYTPVESTERIAIGYLHGQAYACGSSISSTSMEANHIYLLTHAVNNDGTQDHHAHDDNEVYNAQVDYVVNANAIANSILDRSQGPVGVGYWTKPNGVLEVQIDIDKFVYGATDSDNDDANPGGSIIRGGIVYTTYWRTVHIYRCPNPGQHNVGDRQCWSDASNIYLQVSEKIIPKTCVGKYGENEGYQRNYTPPTWFSSFDIDYNDCYGTSVLGSRLRVNNSDIIIKRSKGDSSTANIAYVKPGATVNFDQFFFSAAQPVTKTIIEEGLTGAPGLPGGQWQNRYQVISTINGGNNASWSDGTSGITGSPSILNLTTPYKVENGHASGNPTTNGSNSWKVGTGDTITQTNYGDKTNLGSASIGNLNVDGVTNVTATIGVNPTISVAAPYNFSNTAKADATTGNSSIVFVGETANIRSSFTTNPVANGIVVTASGESNVYATKSPGSYLRLYTYYAGSNESGNSGSIVGSVSCSTLGKSGCEERDEGSNITLNSGENVNGATKSGSNISIDVPDVNAGQWLCAIAAVYPATSGSAANLSTSGFSGWYVSSPSCVQIAKKPTFQIWNGNLYTRGAIQSNVANKRTVSGHNEITSSNPRAFGSWVEHGIIAGGNNNNAGSGAIFGYQTNSSTNLSNNPGGHAEGTTPAVCKRSPLTIANQNCVTNNAGSASGNSGVAIVETVNLDEHKSAAAQAQPLPTDTNVVLSSSNRYKDAGGIRYFYNASTSGKVYLSADNLAAGANYVVYSKGSVYINGNITYTNGGYTSPSNVPQLIIITDGSIFIDGNVTRVDAWLIAKSSDSNKGIIRTCADSNGNSQNEATCSKQLRINGPIVARQLELNRVYGAAPGNNSATAAEIINLSPATYVFSQSKASDNATLRTVYSKEVAPRW